MKNLLKILVPFLGLSSYANAQSDTIIVNKEYVVKETKINEDKTILDEKNYKIEESRFYNRDGKIYLEMEKKLSFIEKNISNPGEPKNLINRKQIDEFLEYMKIYEYKYDSLGRLTETEKTENSSPGKGDIKKTKTYFTYEDKNENPVKIWEDLNNDGKYNQGDKIRVYVPELDKWVSQGE